MLLVGAVLAALPGEEGEVPSLSSPGRALMSLLQPAGRWRKVGGRWEEEQPG